MACLETQPTELLLFILCAFDSLADLHSSISASPRCLQIFLANRSTVLWAVLQRVISPKAFNLAIAAVSAPVVPVTAYPSERDDILCNFLRPFMSGDAEFLAGITKNADPLKVAKLHASVERLANEYIHETIPAFAACCDPVLGHECDDLKNSTSEIDESHPTYNESEQATAQMHIKISESERERLQTALYLYEVYCRAFDYTSNGHAVPISIQCDLFIRHLQSWELEQLASLLFFFVSRLAHHFELTQRKFIEYVRKNAVMDDFEMQKAHGWTSKHVRIPRLGMGAFEDFHRSPSARYSALCALACHGLRFLQEVMSPGTSPERRIELLLTTDGLRPRSLDSALETTGGMRNYRSGLDVFPLKSTGQGGSTMPNAFFDQHTKTALWEGTDIMKPERLGFRATGFVFWDASRIDHDKVHKRLLETSKRGPSYLVRFLPVQDSSADSMVVGLNVTNATWDMLNAKYNSRRVKVAARHFSEEESELQSDYKETWARSVVGWWDGNYVARDGGWISASRYLRRIREAREAQRRGWD
ncbi:hypothetical protein CC79DRAFT_1398718 [Sarocladium strictum]